MSHLRLVRTEADIIRDLELEADSPDPMGTTLGALVHDLGTLLGHNEDEPVPLEDIRRDLQLLHELHTLRHATQ